MMNEMEERPVNTPLDYKEDVAQTRRGCLGSSDGKLLAQVCALGYVPKSAYKRLAVCKGLIEQEEIPRTAAVRAGDAMEMLIYKHIAASDPRYESNPRWVSERYSTSVVKLISHPDIVLRDDARKTLFIYEVKTTKYTFEETRQTYKSQLFIHYTIGREIADHLGRDWNVKLSLVHYDTDGLDLDAMDVDTMELDVNRLTIKEVRMSSSYFDVRKAMATISEFLDGMTEYYEGEEIDADYLPAQVKTQFDDIAVVLREIKERETKVDEFKKRLFEFMDEKDIKSIKNDYFSITRVDASEQKSFDHKRYIEDMQRTHPRKAKKVLVQYTKTTKKRGYVTIKVNEKKDDNKQ